MSVTPLLSSPTGCRRAGWKLTIAARGRDLGAVGAVVGGGPAGPGRPADERVRSRGELADEDVQDAVVVLEGEVVGVATGRRCGCRRPRSPGGGSRRCRPAPLAPGVRLTSGVVLATRSRTKMFVNAGLRPATGYRRPTRRRRSGRRPRCPGRRSRRPPPAPPGPEARLASVVVPATRSRTKMFVNVSSSSVERLSASDANTTKRPVAGDRRAARVGVPRGAARACGTADEDGRSPPASRTKTSRTVVVLDRDVVGVAVEGHLLAAR